MKPRATPASRATPFLMTANESHTPDTGCLVDLKELRSHAMDRAIGIEEPTLSTVVDLNSYLIDVYTSAFWFAPAFANLSQGPAQVFACYMQLQMNWLTLFSPPALSHAVVQRGTVTSGFRMQAGSPAEELAHFMDIAIGESGETQGSTVTSVSGSQARRATAGG